MDRPWMRALAFAGALLFTAPAFAQQAAVQLPDIPGAPHTIVAGETYAVFDVTTLIGDYVQLVKKQPNGMMSPVGTCVTDPDYSVLDNLNAATSDAAYVKGKIHEYNDKFPKCIKAYFDSVTSTGTPVTPTTAAGRINAVLGSICGFNSANAFVCAP